MARPFNLQFIDKWLGRTLLVTTALYCNPQGCLGLCAAHLFNFLINKGIEYAYENNAISKEHAKIASKTLDCLNCVTFEFYRKTFEQNLQFYLEPDMAKATSRAFTLTMAATQASAFKISYSFEKKNHNSQIFFNGFVSFIGICVKELFDFNTDKIKIGTFFNGVSNYWWKTKIDNFSTSTMLTKSTAKLVGFYAAHTTIAMLSNDFTPKIIPVYAGDIAKNLATHLLENSLSGAFHRENRLHVE